MPNAAVSFPRMPTILVVEDEMLIRLHVADTFRDCGFKVIEAADGAKAIEHLQGKVSIDAVFTDVTLPGQPDGFGVARWVRNHLPGVPVVLTSGEVTLTHAHAISKDEPFFAKPCDYNDVAAFIRGLLQKCDA
jgi:DNA-binding NtrC family response regulator